MSNQPRLQGLQEQAYGEHQYDAARIKGHNEAAVDAVVGKTEAEAGAVKGDRSQQRKGINFTRRCSIANREV
ncbi:hypothetical protein L218DRAFT_993453 [Marasmius fiardii PR-910]|nr:hypothetical protein L218DRAFT_993453 [Marasmius fiardii PR-910]